MVARNARLLPIAELDGVEWLVDVQKRELRLFTNPNTVVPMHSKEGRDMVQAMQGMEWRCLGLDSGTVQAEG